ncbi:DMT family transporter [Caldimonas sp. KR1-144]|uniref:DMT family transporter n=1 Tax=Caldimonas sp. KR1-144 TaxID=3400911 RepID=UPI003C064CEB
MSTLPFPAAADSPIGRADAAAKERARVRRGLALGLLGVALFAVTPVATRLAVGDAAAPQLSPLFVTAGRAAVAGLLAALTLLLTRAPRPPREARGALMVTLAGVVFGFPLGLALALREVEAVHASVVTGVLPLATAVVGALLLRQRASRGFWACGALAAALVVAYAVVRGGGHWRAADGWLLFAMASAAIGYVQGARLSQQMSPERVIGWVLVMALPVTLPLAAWAAWHSPIAWAEVRALAWAGFAYVAVVSMWLGFFAWYRALALGGTLRVSQVQALQPFISMLVAVPLLGESIDGATLGFALAVGLVVWIGRRMPVGAARR